MTRSSQLCRGRTTSLLSIALATLVTAIAAPAYAGGGLLGIDHRWNYDDSGIWNRNLQLGVLATLFAGDVATALWEGGDSRIGRTAWKSIDSTAIAGASAYALKYAFSRRRPTTTDDPNEWFSGHGNASFPSGEVTVTSAMITPFVLEYGKDHPAIYALELLPLYDAIARIKVRGHWQSDVIAGYALGTAVGYFVQRSSHTPLILSVMPQQIYIGIGKRW
ncbi:MAG: phosphatase PAP2 family protein [Pseudomonadota bacterium]